MVPGKNQEVSCRQQEWQRVWEKTGAGLSFPKCGKIECVYATVDFGMGKKLFLYSLMLHFVVSVQHACSVLKHYQKVVQSKKQVYWSQKSTSLNCSHHCSSPGDIRASRTVVAMITAEDISWLVHDGCQAILPAVIW
jgi:hypothetical protein